MYVCVCGCRTYGYHYDLKRVVDKLIKFGGLIFSTNVSKLTQGFVKMFITLCFRSFKIFSKWVFYSKTFFIEIIQS